MQVDGGNGCGRRGRSKEGKKRIGKIKKEGWRIEERRKKKAETELKAEFTEEKVKKRKQEKENKEKRM